MTYLKLHLMTEDKIMSDKEHKWHDLPGYTNYVTETEKHTENTNDMTENTIAYT